MITSDLYRCMLGSQRVINYTWSSGFDPCLCYYVNPGNSNIASMFLAGFSSNNVYKYQSKDLLTTITGSTIKRIKHDTK